MAGRVVAIERNRRRGERRRLGRGSLPLASWPFIGDGGEMPARRVSVRKIRELLRLLWECGLSQRQVAGCCGIGKTTVVECVARARRSGLDWSTAALLSDEELEIRLSPPVELVPAAERPAVDWAVVHTELKRKGVTLSLLWEEYREREPRGYRYSWYCELYGQWRGRADLSMRQVHRAGEKLFVDYCGKTVPVVDAGTGEAREAQVFVAVWGASNLTFAEATWSQGLSDWVGSHVRAFEFGGGLTEIVVPDNLKSAVSRPCRYEPELNPTYHDLAVHYGVAVMPARVRKPRDKAKVEVGVQVVERWILARLRHRTFFSLAELNEAIGGLLSRLNERTFRELGAAGSAAVTGAALHLRRVDEGARRGGLPRRSRRPLLQRAVPAGEPTAGRAGEREDGEILRQEQAGGEPSPQLSPGSPYDAGRAHAAAPSRIR